LEAHHKFSIPYTPSISEYLEKLSEIEIRKINDIYFSDNTYRSARNFDFTDDYWQELFYIKEKFPFIKLHYVINPSVVENGFYTKKEIDILVTFLNYLYDTMKVEIITLSNSYLFSDKNFLFGRPKDLEYKLSVNNHISTIEQMKFISETIEINSIVLDRGLNRNLDKIIDIVEYNRKEKNLSLSLLVNEGCIPECFFKKECDNFICQKNNNNFSMEETLVEQNLGCRVLYQFNPSISLKSPFITYENARFLSNFISIFKISGRMMTKKILFKIFDYYLKGNRLITLKELVSSPINSLFNNITMADLEEKKFSSKVIDCGNKCSECNFCEEIFSNILKEKING